MYIHGMTQGLKMADKPLRITYKPRVKKPKSKPTEVKDNGTDKS